MTESLLVKVFEHNNWANHQIIQVCSALSDEHLDAAPLSATFGSIRHTLVHLVAAQQGYLSLLTLPVAARHDASPAFAELLTAAHLSGEGLLVVARDVSSPHQPTQLRTTDGYLVEPWVVLVQAINHASEHREQISSMLSVLGVTPPALDGWTYGEVTKALMPVGT